MSFVVTRLAARALDHRKAELLREQRIDNA